MGYQKARLAENRAESDAYEQTLRRILSRADTLDAEAVVALRQLVRDMQKRVNERLAYEVTSQNAERTWGPFWVPQLIRAVSDTIGDMAARAGEELGGFLASSWELGSEMVDASLKAVTGLDMLGPAITPYTLTVLAPFSAQLITRIDEATREAIDKSLRVGIALGESPGEIMDKLKADLGDTSAPWRTVAYKSEIITRTEVSRVQTLASEARVNAARLEFPDELEDMKQIFVSVTRGEWPCKICEPYDQSVWDIDDPRKPVPPMHPNCRCALAPYFDGISSPPIPKDERLSDVTLTECHCC